MVKQARMALLVSVRKSRIKEIWQDGPEGDLHHLKLIIIHGRLKIVREIPSVEI